MRAAVVSIGSELLHGVLTDTNATFLTQELTSLGIEVVEVVQVGDDLDRLVAAFRRLLTEADLIVSTGGLGPTDDDLTRETLATICNEIPVVDPELVEQIRAYFRTRGLDMPAGNEKQAWLIPSAEAIVNPMGTAPGWFLHVEGRLVAVMPGPPRENQPMWTQRMAPLVLAELTSDTIITRTIKTIGIGESAAERAIKDLVQRRPPIIATYAKSDGIHIRITSVAQDHRAAREVLDAARLEVLERLGQYVYGEDGDSLAYAILQPLLARDVQLGLWEAGSAGRLTSLLESDDLVAEVVPDTHVSTYARAEQEFGSGDGPERIALLCAREIAQSTGNGVAAALAVNITPADETLPPGYARGAIGIAFVHPAGELVKGHAVNTVPDEIRRRATLWAAEFLLGAIRDATAAQSA